jgi:hypothetical protein
MTFLNVLVGIINILMFIFLLFPNFLTEVTKMDPYKLGVLCVFFACLIYWAYLLIIFIKHRNKLKVSINSGSARIISNPDGYQYLVEGDTCFHIPDPDTFNFLGNFFGFTWRDSQLMLPDEIKRNFKIGKALPSIRVYFPKLNAQKD